MDVDKIQRQVTGLVAFRTKVEQFLSNAGHDLEAEAGVQSLGERVAALEAASGSGTADSGLADRVASLESKFEDISSKLADLPAILDGVSKLADLAAQKDRLLAAADWVDQNGQQVAELLKIGDDLAGTAAGTSGSASGAGSATGGTNPAPDATASGGAS